MTAEPIVTAQSAPQILSPVNEVGSADCGTQIIPTVNDLSLHGVFAGTFDFLGLEPLIDMVIGKRSHLMKINHGAAIKAMVMQVLSAPYQSLYRTDEYFSRIPLAVLLNKGVEASVLNRHTLSRMLDDIADFGPKKLFTLLAAQTCRKLEVNVREAHIDSTSFHCDSNEKEEEGCELKIGYGYSRDHRPDLPQVIMLGLADGTSKLPIYANAISGNISDRKSFFDLVAKDWPLLAKEFKDLKYLVGDSALCTAEILAKAKQNEMEIVTRVPDSYAIAKKCFEQGNSETFSKVNEQEPDGSTGLWCGKDRIGDTEVKLLLINNENMRESKTRTLRRRAEKQLEKMQRELNELETHPAACERDAQAALEKIKKKYAKHLCKVTEYKFEEVKKYRKAGRPRKDAEKELAGVKVIAEAAIDEEELKQAVTQELRYVIATTDTKRQWSMAELLSTYHRQSAIERMWRVSKDPKILINAIYLKKPSRITALIWLLAVALLVFAATEYKLRQSAEAKGIKEVNLVTEQKRELTITQAAINAARQQQKNRGGNRQLQSSGKKQLPAEITKEAAAKKTEQYKLTLMRFKQYVQNSHISIFIDSNGKVQVVGQTTVFRQMLQGMGEHWEHYYRDETYSVQRLRELFAGQPMTEDPQPYEVDPII